MAVRKTVTVSVTPEQRTFVGEPERSGHHAGAGEVVEAALKPLERGEPDFQFRERARLADASPKPR